MFTKTIKWKGTSDTLGLRIGGQKSSTRPSGIGWKKCSSLCQLVFLLACSQKAVPNKRPLLRIRRRGRDYRPLTHGTYGPMNALHTLTVLIGWVRGANALNRTIARKIRDKLAELGTSEPSALRRHFAYGMLIHQFYRARDLDPA